MFPPRHQIFFAALVVCCSAGAHAQASWTSSGQGLQNRRYQPSETTINTQNVGSLAVKWSFTTGGDVSATPTVSNGVVYVPDDSGDLYAINAATGTAIWSQTMAAYEPTYPDVYTRSSPAISGNSLIIADLVTKTETHPGAHVLAVNKATGALLWNTQVDTHPAAIITGSPVVANGVVLVGVSSNEEGLTTTSGYACCTFRGSVVALNATTGEKLWQTYMVPDNSGKPGAYSGGAVWAPLSVNLSGGLVYVTTGNNYTVPPSVAECQQQNINSGTTVACTAADDYFESVLALDLATGAVRWATKMSIYDAFNNSCVQTPPGTDCPSPDGGDYDLSGGGANFTGGALGVGQKSGYFRALDPNTGKILWRTQAGPGGRLGGVLFGAATDGKRYYVSEANYRKVNATLINGQTITWGFWNALDANTGKILWQTPEPTSGTTALSSMSTANGVVYIGSFAKTGNMYALDASTGKILWSFASGGSVLNGPAIVDGVVYWGSGYNKFSVGKGNNKLFAFSLP